MQAESFRALSSEAQTQVAHAEQARAEDKLEIKSLRNELHATQQRMRVLKEQLMNGQAAAEESEQQAVQDAVHRAEAAFGEKLRALQLQVCAVCCSSMDCVVEPDALVQCCP
jgi:predicted phage tail protein